jgi:lipopolysaccharide/colanic/teichoic acid biosynthesis glycosyltransferase
MTGGWRYRVTSISGTAVLTVAAIWVANARPVQEAFAQVPYFGRPAPAVLSGGALLLAVATALAVVLASAWPLFKPQPRRILDAALETQRRVVVAMIGLAALGYFNYTYRLPRSTLMLATAGLLVFLPPFMIAIRRRPRSGGRALLVGDDPDAMRTVLSATSQPVAGYVGPSNLSGMSFTADGDPVERVSGLSRIRDAIVDTDVDTALLAFGSSDRAEFFGTLATCHEHGLAARIHRDYADSVLTARDPGGELVHVDIEPWDLQDRLLKRLFDLGFAVAALLVLAPVVLVIAAAIKLDDGGAVLYSQERTAEFGDTFTVYKFRTMRSGGAETTPGSERDRVTRVGRLLRRTHLDEIPQLWTILTGRMSVVGPRATWTDEESHLEAVASTWRKRWFVKPGLTGLAQINGATSADPEAKLRYDLQYVREQSFRTDLEIVLRQLWQVGYDAVCSLGNTDEDTAQASDESGRTGGTDGPARTPDRPDATVARSDGPTDDETSGVDGSPTRPVRDGGPGQG